MIPRGFSVLAIVALVGCKGADEQGVDIVEEAGPVPTRVADSGIHPPATAVQWLAAGGGALPQDNQLSIEADLALVRDTLGPDNGILLYAGGEGTRAVQVADSSRRGDPLRALLGDLFDPRAGRNASYRRTTLSPAGAATLRSLTERLKSTMSTGETPLTLYLTGHGEPSSQGQAVRHVTWGGQGFTPAELASLFDRGTSKRPVQLVMTSCYSGAFANVAFRLGDRGNFARPAVIRCGLFATTEDRPSSGCDPNPDRRQHESYTRHLMHALMGQDHMGAPLAPAEVDFDGDGQVTWLEAHARARIALTGFDVPTSTSELWLRVNAPLHGEGEVHWPEETAVVEALAARLGISPSGAGLTAEVERQAQAIATLETRLTPATEAELDAFDAVVAVVLNRWPWLNDPWHPDFEPGLTRERAAIEAWFREDPRYQDYWAAFRVVDQLAGELDAASIKLAPYLRLQRALEFQLLAGWMKADGGPRWDYYLALRRCEAGQPITSSKP
ncbi:MAG: hypothetical protein ACI9MR_004535 [Myxococcota bacterium]